VCGYVLAWCCADLVWSLYRNNLMFPQVKMGLENMVALNKLMGTPTSAFHAVHVAGTNGKVRGSGMAFCVVQWCGLAFVLLWHCWCHPPPLSHTLLLSAGHPTPHTHPRPHPRGLCPGKWHALFVPQATRRGCLCRPISPAFASVCKWTAS